MNVVILGINGKMGKYVYQVLSNRNGINILGGIDKKKSLNIRLEDDIDKFEDVDLLIDFSCASISYEIIKKALNNGIRVLSGTTGIEYKKMQDLKRLSNEKKISFVWSPNYSKGAAYMYKLILDTKNNFDVADIFEIHSPSKIDAPSGTAKEFSRLLEFDNVQYLRLNDVLATHEVIFSSTGEKLSIKHEIFNRSAFLKSFLFALDKILIDEYLCIVGLDDFFKLIK